MTNGEGGTTVFAAANPRHGALACAVAGFPLDRCVGGCLLAGSHTEELQHLFGQKKKSGAHLEQETTTSQRMPYAKHTPHFSMTSFVLSLNFDEDPSTYLQHTMRRSLPNGGSKNEPTISPCQRFLPAKNKTFHFSHSQPRTFRDGDVFEVPSCGPGVSRTWSVRWVSCGARSRPCLRLCPAVPPT